MEFKNHREAKNATLDWLLWYNRSRMALDLALPQPSSVREASTRSNTRPRSVTAKVQPQPTKVQNQFAYGRRVLRASSGKGNVSFHTAASTAFPQAAPGAAGATPGPMAVPSGKLQSVLGVTDVKFVRGQTIWPW
jgi:hypothetical protein